MNLQCPARLVLVAEPAALLAAAGDPADRRIARIYAPAAEAVPASVAERLGTTVGVVPELRAPAAGEPRDETVRRIAAAVDELADQHRGETVLLLADPAFLGLTGSSAEVEHDGTGWWVVA